MQNQTIKIVVGLVGIVLVIAGGILWKKAIPQSSPQTAQSLVIYSGRKEPLIIPVIRAFEKDTGIKVTVKSGSSEELALIIMKEGDKSPADLYMGTDAGLLDMLSQKKLLTPITTDKLNQLPAQYRSVTNTWTGVSGRSRVLIVNTDLVPEEEFPTSVSDIIDPKWRGKVALAKLTNESVVTHLSALRILQGETATQQFLLGLKANEVTFLPGHTDVRQAVARGEYAIGLVNHYYGHLQQQESDNIAIIYPDQDEGGVGAFVNVSGVGILVAGKNQTEAQLFVDYLLKPETQSLFAKLNFEYPLMPGIPADSVRQLDSFAHVPVSLDKAGSERQKTLELIRTLGL